MIGWVPDVYETIEELPEDMPESLKNHIEKRTTDNNGVVPKVGVKICSWVSILA